MSDARIERLLRELTPQVLGAVIRRYGDFGMAEDAVQEALLAASTQWPVEGMPDDPRAWLIRTAARRLADLRRSAVARKRREMESAPNETVQPVEPGTPEDDSLVLLFMCCHPSLTTSSAIALTLRAFGGLGTAEIARAFLVPEATMAQRISRAKQTVQQSGVPFELPADVTARLPAVLHVLYLIFNEGYTSSEGTELQKVELSTEAIRLTRAVHALLPEHAEVAGLLALMLLTDARREARTGPNGELIPLTEQDRSRWDHAQIAEGVALLSATLPRGAVGPYQLQAAIAAVHDEAESAEATDWPQILALYGLLRRMQDNPMVLLNEAIALAMVHGPEAGLKALEALSDRLRGHHRLDATRAHLLERAGDPVGAIAAYRAAADRTTNVPERDYLLSRAARLRG